MLLNGKALVIAVGGAHGGRGGGGACAGLMVHIT